MDIKNKLPALRFSCRRSLLYATSFPSSAPSFLPSSNLFRRLGTPALLPGNLDNPHLGSLGCSCRGCLLRFDCLQPLQLLDSTWRHRSAVPGQSSGRSGWLPGRSPSVETWCCCHTCLCPVSGRKWHASSLEQSSQPKVETDEGKYSSHLIDVYLFIFNIYCT